MSQQQRPQVDVTGGDLHQHVNDTWTALIAANDPQHPEVLLRGDTLTRLARDEQRIKLEPYRVTTLRDRMSQAAVFVREAQKGAQQVKPPADVASILLDRSPHELSDAPRVNRVTDVPVYGADKSLLTTPGYHPGSRTYYQPFGDELGALSGDWGYTGIGEQMRQEDVDNAKAWLLDELLGDFPFADAASKAHALCMILEPFVREQIGDHPTPLYVVMAPTHGTGKSRLVKVCLSVGCGQVPESPPPDRDEPAWQKRLFSSLLEAPPAIWLDNVSQRLDSASLAAALTSTRWTDRVLGQSRMMDVPIRNVWVATMNNPSISLELTRRAVPIFLDARVAEPWTRSGPEPGRTWQHPLPGWAFEHRAELVYAALTLVKNWQFGSYSDLDTVFGSGEGVVREVGSRFLASYEEWSRVMGGILQAAGGKAFLTNLNKLHADADADRGDAEAFLAEWHARVQEPLTLDGVLELLARDAPLTADAPIHREPIPLPLELRVRKDLLPSKLGVWLRTQKGAIIGGFILKNDGKKPARWWVEKVI